MTNLEAIKALLTRRVLQKVNEGTISKPRAKKLIIEGILNLTGTKVVEKIREDEESNKPSKWKKVARVARKGAIYAAGTLGGMYAGGKLGKKYGGKAGEGIGSNSASIVTQNTDWNKEAKHYGKLAGGVHGRALGAKVGKVQGAAVGLAAAHALNRKLDERRKRKEEATQQINKQMTTKNK